MKSPCRVGSPVAEDALASRTSSARPSRPRSSSFTKARCPEGLVGDGAGRRHGQLGEQLGVAGIGGLEEGGDGASPGHHRPAQLLDKLVGENLGADRRGGEGAGAVAPVDLVTEAAPSGAPDRVRPSSSRRRWLAGGVSFDVGQHSGVKGGSNSACVMPERNRLVMKFIRSSMLTQSIALESRPPRRPG